MMHLKLSNIAGYSQAAGAYWGSGGGGASDVSRLGTKIVVAGGGGGCANAGPYAGGKGGGLIGGTGARYTSGGMFLSKSTPIQVKLFYMKNCMQCI